jgi:methyl-accepting chemotaxis protein
MSDQVKQVTAAAQDLAGMAQALHRLVDQFKL